MTDTTAPVAMTDDAQVKGHTPAQPRSAGKDQGASHIRRESFGQVVMAMIGLPRNRQQSLGDLAQMVRKRLIRDRIAMARRAKKEPGLLTVITGFAIWASVSEEVDAKIPKQINVITFPIRLKPVDCPNWSVNCLASWFGRSSP